jgi:hypothetical protein
MVVPAPATTSDSTGGVNSPAAPIDTTSPPQTGATPASSASIPAGPPADTLRGVIVRVGNDPVSVLVLRLADETIYALKTTDVAQLGRVEGLEVMVSGKRLATKNYSASPRGAAEFEMKHFVVRAADGQPATDGVVRVTDGAYALETADGSRKPAPHFPAELRVKAGSRVFLVGPLNQPPVSYGIISQPK